MSYDIRKVHAQAQYLTNNSATLWQRMEAGLVHLIDSFYFKTTQERTKWKASEHYWRQLSLQYDQQHNLPQGYTQLWLDTAIAILSGGNFIIPNYMPDGSPLEFFIPPIGRLPRLVKTCSGQKVKVVPKGYIPPPDLGILFVCREFVECLRVFGPGAQLEDQPTAT